MDPLSITASIIAVIQLTGTVVSAVYGYRKDVKNAPEDAAKIIHHLIGLSQILEKLLQLIEQERSVKTAQLSSVEALLKPDGPLELCQKTLQHLNAKLRPEHGWRGVKQSLVWPLKKDYIKKTLDDIAAAKATIGLALTVDQVSLAIDTKSGVDALTSSFETFRLDEERRAALSKVSPVDAAISHLKARKKHQVGTGDWLLASKQYLEWVDGVASFFWINGIPGCGKTILCSVAIEDLIQNHQQYKVRTAVAYYYFNFQTREEQQFVNLLRSITLQLSCQCPRLPNSVQKLQWQPEWVFSCEYLVGIIEDLLKEFQDVYIVIDALDECEQNEEVLRWIEGLLEKKNDQLHVLVSSRQDYHFQLELERLASLMLKLDQQTFAKDIETYIHERLSTDPRMKKWPSDVRDDIKQSLVSNAGGL
ncbi:MAG: hypothetical protein OHK93_005773 [Ramalina farinacea]|uniref:Nephrocystin 3-like N-terminal domain-containing protein n=1 Tax=Ramalina farinacea TaxID=258253 RepID=A0AA43TW77_9LECA|nr:hypothetical protein [Ramalina farinacea]